MLVLKPDRVVIECLESPQVEEVRSENKKLARIIDKLQEEVASLRKMFEEQFCYTPGQSGYHEALCHFEKQRENGSEITT